MATAAQSRALLEDMGYKVSGEFSRSGTLYAMTATQGPYCLYARILLDRPNTISDGEERRLLAFLLEDANTRVASVGA